MVLVETKNDLDCGGGDGEARKTEGGLGDRVGIGLKNVTFCL